MRAAVRPGVTTCDLDRIAEEHIRSRRGVPVVPGLPGTHRSRARSARRSMTRSCTASPATGLVEGDVVSLDCGAIVDGWHGDAAITVAGGRGGRRPARAGAGHRGRHVARDRRGASRRPGRRHLARRREPRAQPGLHGIVEEYVGHGIGTAMHQPPNVPNLGRPGRGAQLVEGLALAVEPMVTLGTRRPSCSRTTGPWSPSTAAWPPTSSTPLR